MFPCLIFSKNKKYIVKNANEFPINQMFKIIKTDYTHSITIDADYSVKKTGTDEAPVEVISNDL